MKSVLQLSDYRRAADLLNVAPAAIMAVADIEAPMGGFIDDIPRILFERHWFSKLTRHKYDDTYPDISNRTPGGYMGGVREHSRLQRAVVLDREAALKSASWGKFQIMGFNYALCGCKTLQVFINLMYQSEQAHLGLFVNFLESTGLTKYLRKEDFASFAYEYNGPNYRKFNYDTRLDAAFVEHERRGYT